MNEKDNLEKNNNKLKGKRNDEKYIKEMHDMADKHAKRNNKIFIAVVIPVVVICIFVVKQIFSFSLDSAKKDSKPKTEFANETKTNDKNKSNSQDKEKNDTSALGEKIGKYLDKEDNRKKSLDKAISINKGSNKGVSIIYISEVLRNNGIDIPKSTLSTKSLVAELEKQGFEKITDYKKLQKGDIAFTSNDKNGNPSHAYIFLKWSKEGKTNYGTVCDGQISEYGTTIHKRNISVSTTTKDKISFFMRKK